jgi:hypothetical protein
MRSDRLQDATKTAGGYGGGRGGQLFSNLPFLFPHFIPPLFSRFLTVYKTLPNPQAGTTTTAARAAAVAGVDTAAAAGGTTKAGTPAVAAATVAGINALVVIWRIISW